MAICTVLGRSLNLYGDLSFVKSDAIHLALSLFFLVGYSCLFYLFFELVFYFIERISRLGNDSQTSFAKVFGIRFAVILACYLPYMIVMFPGHTSSDFIGELRQFYGAIPAGNHHPWFMTMLFGALFQAGSFVVGSSQGGVFLVSFVQTVAMASTFAFFVALLSKAGCPRAVGLGLTAFFALCPIFPIYAQWCVKNTLSAIFLAHFAVQLTLRLLGSERIAPRYSSWPAVFFTALVSALSRNDFIYIVIAFLVAAVILLKARQRVAVAVVTVAVASLFILWSNVILPAAGIASGNVREVLSLPLLQTTKCVAVHFDDLTEEEKGVLQEACSVPLSDLPDLYSSTVSDSVKSSYTFEEGELGDYFRAYLAMGLKYPDVYIQVFLAHTFGYWYTGASGGFVASETVSFSEPMVHPSFFDQALDDKVDLTDTVYDLEEAFPWAKGLLVKVMRVLCELPIVSPFLLPALYFWVAIVSATILWRKDRRSAAVLVPILVLFLICCASPLNGSTRYALPIILLAPVMFGWACIPARKAVAGPLCKESGCEGSEVEARRQGHGDAADRTQ